MIYCKKLQALFKRKFSELISKWKFLLATIKELTVEFFLLLLELTSTNYSAKFIDLDSGGFFFDEKDIK
jgi:hypothetical protein